MINRPKSLTLLIFFVAWSVFKGLESLLRPEDTRSMYAEYGLEALYFLVVVISVVGGAAFLYALVKRISWGAIMGQVWLAVAILHTIFTGYVSATSIPLMEQIMFAKNEERGRTMEEISEYFSSGMHEPVAIGTTVVLVGVMLFFLWKVRQHSSFFRSSNPA